MTLIFRSAFSKHLNNCKRLKKNGSWRASKARVNIRKWPSNFFSFHKIPDILAFRLNSVWIILWLFSNKFMHLWMKKLTRYDFLKNFNVLLAYHWCWTSSYFLEYFFILRLEVKRSANFIKIDLVKSPLFCGRGLSRPEKGSTAFVGRRRAKMNGKSKLFSPVLKLISPKTL